jgi:hypothetical protein
MLGKVLDPATPSRRRVARRLCKDLCTRKRGRGIKPEEREVLASGGTLMNVRNMFSLVAVACTRGNVGVIVEGGVAAGSRISILH